jgi:hypothetical protein
VTDPTSKRFQNNATLALGASASCAVALPANSLRCWGQVPHEVANEIYRPTATPSFEAAQMFFRAQSLAGVTATALSEGGGCIQTSGDFFCWGVADYFPANNDAGAVSFDGGIAAPDRLLAAAVGRAHVCAIVDEFSDTDVECWGTNDHGQIGVDPTALPEAAVPMRTYLSNLGMTIKQIAASGDTSCALLDDGHNGAVYCWGRNDRSQLASSSGMDSFAPTRVAIGSPYRITDLTMGDAHVCVLDADYRPWCWGDDTFGQLGVGGASGGQSAQPRLVQQIVEAGTGPLKGVQFFAAGGKTTCGIMLGDPRPWCWGANDAFQAGQPDSGPIVYFARPVGW